MTSNDSADALAKKQKRREYRRRYYLLHKDKIRADARKSEQKNRLLINARRRDRYNSDAELRERRNAAARVRYQKNPSKRAEYQRNRSPQQKRLHYLRCRDWAKRNKLKIKQYDRENYVRNAGRIKARSTLYARQHPGRVKTWRKAAYIRSRSRIEIVIATRLRNRLRQEIRRPTKRNRKLMSALELVGCPIPSLIEHLEKQFQAGMNWHNYGTRWHIDHIRPVSSFNLMCLNEQRDCFHFRNLQPLWAHDNQKKGASRFSELRKSSCQD